MKQFVVLLLLLGTLCSWGAVPPTEPISDTSFQQQKQQLGDLVSKLKKAILSRDVDSVKSTLAGIEDFGKSIPICPTCPPKKQKSSTSSSLLPILPSPTSSQELERKRMIALFNECSVDLRHARQVLDASKRQQDKEVEKLKQVQSGVVQLMNSLKLTQVDLMQAQRETSEREQELNLFHAQAATAAKIERDIIEIQQHARVNYETGELEIPVAAEGDSKLLFEELSKVNPFGFLAAAGANGGVVAQGAKLPIDAAIMHANPTLLLDFVILLAASTLGGAIARATASKTIPFPHIVGFLLAGALVGPNGFLLVNAVIEVDTLAQFGSVFFIFGLGLEFSPSREQRSFQAMSVGGTLLVTAMIAVTVQLCTLVLTGIVESPLEGLLLGMSVSLSSLGVVMDHLRLHKLLQSTPAKVLIGMLGFQGFLVCVFFSIPPALITTTTTVGTGQDNGEPRTTFDALVAVFVTVVLAIASATFALMVAKYILPSVLPLGISNELYLLCAVALSMFMAMFTFSLGLSLDLGAFFAGLMLSELDAGSRRTKDLILPLASVFSSILFASLGMMLNWEFFWKNLGEICFVALQLVVIKMLVVWIVARLFDFSFRTAVFCAVSLCHVGELSLLFSSKLQAYGLLSRRAYLIFLAATCVTLTTAPLVMRILANARVTNWINRWDMATTSTISTMDSAELTPVQVVMDEEDTSTGSSSNSGVNEQPFNNMTTSTSSGGDFTSAWRRKV